MSQDTKQRWNHQTVRRLHIATDIVFVSLGWIGAYWVRSWLGGFFPRPINPFEIYVTAVPIVVATWMLSCWWFGIYQASRMKTFIGHTQDLLRGGLLGLMVLSAIAFFWREAEFGRSVVLSASVLIFGLQAISRGFYAQLEERLRREGQLDVPALILGAEASGIRLLQKIQDHPEIGYRVIGFLEDAEIGVGEIVENRPVLGEITDLRKIVVENGIEEIFIAKPSLEHSYMLSLVLECEDLAVTFRVMTDLFEVLTAGTQIDLVEDLPLVRLGHRGTSPFYAPLRRCFDLAMSVLVFGLGFPFLLWWALRIKLDSPGPVIFSQDRVGKGGEIFRMYKFRTMRCDVDPYEEAPKKEGDPRITAYGEFLRKTSIDEMPQFINILKGEMALVGPRPEMPFIVDTYEEWQRRRLTVKPGITGLWQILGRKDIPMHCNLQYDFYYIRNRSLFLDISILIRTVGAVLLRKGAY